MVLLFRWRIFLLIDVSNRGLGEGLVWVGDVILLEGTTDCKPIFKEPYKKTQVFLSKLSPGLIRAAEPRLFNTVLFIAAFPQYQSTLFLTHMPLPEKRNALPRTKIRGRAWAIWSQVGPTWPPGHHQEASYWQYNPSSWVPWISSKESYAVRAVPKTANFPVSHIWHPTHIQYLILGLRPDCETMS